MIFTGERYIPGYFRKEDFISQTHYKRYEFALDFVIGKKVLDIACGEGYGSFLLAEKAGEVMGIDIDQNIIANASKKYQRKNLNFMISNATSIPLKDSCVDVIVSFETIEHIKSKSQKKFLSETVRLLSQNGVLIISTPDKDIYGEGYNQFHEREMNNKEFMKLLKNYFFDVQLFGQHILKYSNPSVYKVKRIISRLIKFDIFKLRHCIPRRWRVQVGQGLNEAVFGKQLFDEGDLFPKKIADDETSLFLVAVCRKAV